jgi:hypothetical protein
VLNGYEGLASAAFRALDGWFRNVRALGELLSAPAEAGTGFPDLRPGLHHLAQPQWRRRAAEALTNRLLA